MKKYIRRIWLMFVLILFLFVVMPGGNAAWAELASCKTDSCLRKEILAPGAVDYTETISGIAKKE